VQPWVELICHRCGRRFDPDRADVDGWMILDAREDGWMLVVCHCEADAERERVRLLS
jgi:hypothetical protein